MCPVRSVTYVSGRSLSIFNMLSDTSFEHCCHLFGYISYNIAA
jgi:hypothetical protein